MDNKQLCLANFLEVPIDRLSHEGVDEAKYRFEDKAYLVLTWEEVYSRFSQYTAENLWKLSMSVIRPHLEVAPEVDLDEFCESLDEVMAALETRSHPLILAHLPDFPGFVNGLIDDEYNKNLGSHFAYDHKQHYSNSFHYYIYRVTQ